MTPLPLSSTDFHGDIAALPLASPITFLVGHAMLHPPSYRALAIGAVLTGSIESRELHGTLFRLSASTVHEYSNASMYFFLPETQ